MKIGCIITLYNPDLSLLKKVLDSITDQVDSIYIADNSLLQIDQNLLKDYKRIVYKKMPGNVGIASAQNDGIKYFKEQNFSHVIFLDQDSIVDKGLLSQLVNDLTYLNNNLIHVGAIGPRPINREINKEYRGSVIKGKSITDQITEVTEIISSASLVLLKNYDDIGLLEESLFIDGVDHEWCWRAKKIKNLRFFISEKAHLSHKLGEGDRFFLFRKVAIPTPFRTYYQFRNYLILARRDYVPVYWKIANGFKYLIKLFYFPVFIKPRKEYLKHIIRGINDGILLRING